MPVFFVPKLMRHRLHPQQAVTFFGKTSKNLHNATDFLSAYGLVRNKMSDTVFINSMLIDFQSENDLELYISTREKAMTPEVYDRLKAAGLKRQVIGKVWNKEQHRLSVTFEYDSKDAFKEVEKIYDEIIVTSDFFKKFPIKFQNNRAVVLLDFVAN